VAEMAALCAHDCAQLAVNQTKAQPMACAQGKRAWGCSSGAAGAFLIMLDGVQKGWFTLNHNRSQR